MVMFLSNATYLDPVTLIPQTTHLRVEAGAHGGIELLEALPPLSERPGAKVIDCRGKLVTKSFACGHHHLYSTFARGMPAPPRVPTNFPEILDLVWWRVDKRLDLPMIEASALATAMLCAKRGVTFVIDHHASPFAVEGSLETIATAFDRVGVGHLLCYEISCRDGEAIKEAGLAETEAYLASGRKGHVGLHASFTVDDDLLQRAVSMAARFDTGLHMHVAEDIADQDHCQREYGMRVVERLEEAGALASNKTILSHCVHLDEKERELLAAAPVWIAQCSESNQNNNVGVGSYGEFADRVMLGTDGMHVDMLRSAKAAHLASQATEGLSFPGAYERFRKVHKHIASMGAPGDGANNLVILDYDSPTALTDGNFLGHFLFGLEAIHVHSVISQGRLIVEDRRLVSGEEAEILAYGREQAFRLWEKLAQGD